MAGLNALCIIIGIFIGGFAVIVWNKLISDEPDETLKTYVVTERRVE